MTMLSDEELALMRGPHWEQYGTPDYVVAQLIQHADALAAEVADRDSVIERLSGDVEDVHREVLRALTDTSAANSEFVRRIGEVTAERDRARDIAVSLEQELAEVQRLAKTVDGLRNVFGDES